MKNLAQSKKVDTFTEQFPDTEEWKIAYRILILQDKKEF